MSFEEFYAFVPMGEDRLFAVVCVPTKELREPAVVLLPGGNYTRSHRNGMWVRAARGLAERGFASIRIDYHGVGDSTGRARFELELPFSDDALAAAEFLKRVTGAGSLLFSATCFGGRSAIAAAARHPDAIGLTLFPLPIAIPAPTARIPLRSRMKRRVGRTAPWLLRHPVVRRLRSAVAPRLSRPASIISPRLKEDLEAFVRRGQVWLVYGEHSSTLPELWRLFDELESSIAPEEWSRVNLEVIPGTVLDRFQTLSDQDVVVERTIAAAEAAARSRVAEGAE